MEINLEEKIENKRNEIANYKIILRNYRGRWWDMGKRYLESLENELTEMEKDKNARSKISNKTDR